MARLMLEDAVLMTGRTPETIERWIASGKVEAERSGNAWLVDMRSLLNVAAAEEAAANGNGHSHDHSPPGSPIDDPDDYGGRRTATVGAVAATPEAVPHVPETPQPTLAMERAAAAYTVDVATSAIGALNTRLEQAMGEIERLQDERLKLALQLGYAQSQLKTAQEQLRMLTAPARPNPLARLLARVLRRA